MCKHWILSGRKIVEFRTITLAARCVCCCAYLSNNIAHTHKHKSAIQMSRIQICFQAHSISLAKEVNLHPQGKRQRERRRKTPPAPTWHLHIDNSLTRQIELVHRIQIHQNWVMDHNRNGIHLQIINKIMMMLPLRKRQKKETNTQNVNAPHRHTFSKFENYVCIERRLVRFFLFSCGRWKEPSHLNIKLQRSINNNRSWCDLKASHTGVKKCRMLYIPPLSNWACVCVLHLAELLWFGWNSCEGRQSHCTHANSSTLCCDNFGFGLNFCNRKTHANRSVLRIWICFRFFSTFFLEKKFGHDTHKKDE